MIKKSLGQNFFINENLGNKIVEYVKQSNPDIIVEIGPGRGFFTKKLSQISPQLLLVEKDDELAKQLAESYPLVINIDFLEWDFEELEKYKGKKIIFFGSLPYNVSKPIIQKILSSNFFNTTAYFIVQKEVAEKYTTLHPENNVLSIRTQLFAKPSRLFNISPGSFFPKPKVESSFIGFSPNKQSYNIDYDEFIRFVEICFKSPRKTLKNNLKNTKYTILNTDYMLKRPQELSLDEYLKLFENMHTAV